MACFVREKSVVHVLLSAIVNGRKTVVNDCLEDIPWARYGKNLHCRIRLDIAACPHDGAFFHNTDEVIAPGVVVMKITIHFFSAGQVKRPICQRTYVGIMWLHLSGDVTGDLDYVSGQQRIIAE